MPKMNTDPKMNRFIDILGWVVIVLAALTLFQLAIVVYWQTQAFSPDFTQNMKDEELPGFLFRNTWLLPISSGLPPILFLIGGIGLIKRKNWGRMLLISLFWIGIVYIFFTLVILAVTQYSPVSFGLPLGPFGEYSSIILVGILLGFHIGLYILFRWLIRRLSSDRVKALFRPDHSS